LTTNTQSERADDRRRFFRIDDEVNLTYKKVNINEMSEQNNVLDDVLNNCSIASAMDALNQESSLVLRRLQKSDSDIADFLKLMDDKIDLIARSVLLRETDFSKQNTREVNISASGLAFASKEGLYAGDYLEVKMLLTSSMSIVVAYGKVVYCKMVDENNNDFPYLIGLDFMNMKEQDRELLIKHVVKRQMQQIRGKKEP